MRTVRIAITRLRRTLAATTPLAVCWLALAGLCRAEPPAPPTGLVATDHPHDNGEAIDLRWALSADDRPDVKPRRVRGYQISRRHLNPLPGKKADDADFRVPYGEFRLTDRKCAPGGQYLYEVAAIGADGELSSTAETPQPVAAVRQWFDGTRAWFGVIMLAVCGAVITYTSFATRGKQLHVREIAALAAMEEAVGRATEMGRPCLFIPGIQDMNEIATVAGITVLSHVARTTADYDASLHVPTSRSLVMTAARETVGAAYLAAGRPDAYNEDNIYYVTDEQFAYVAHVTGYMVREQPAACFYAGVFFAESLILSETGNSIGAIQIAGTSESSQLPFFVAACDYTLIGEELFAASAYLSGDPRQLGSLKGQDAGKLLAALLLLGGCLLATLYEWSDALGAPREAVGAMLTYLRESVLGRGGS
jgi:hypothetical protein